MKYTIVKDDDCHRYIIPYEKLSDWYKLLSLLEGNDECWVLPKYAEPIDGGRIVFEKYEIK